MALDSRHPTYLSLMDDWLLMERSYKGERAIKAADDFVINVPGIGPQNAQYLPPTQVMLNLGMGQNQAGRQMYDAYKKRAVYPGIVRFAIERLVGVLWHKPPLIEVPTVMEPVLKRLTLEGEDGDCLLRRIHEALLGPGRIGLMLDLDVDPETNTARPYIATYTATSILNWDAGNRDDEDAVKTLNLVVLDESEFERQVDFSWKLIEKFRVLALGDLLENEDAGVNYRVATQRATREPPPASDYIEPNIRGNALQEIPFVFINPKDLMPEPDVPPLKPLADLALTIYRGEADYRQTLFMQSQDTLVIIGRQNTDQAVRIGAGTVIDVPIGGDAKYVGVIAAGLAEQGKALQNDKQEAAQLAGQIIDTISKQKESGEALGLRIAAQTASLNLISRTAAAGLERILKIAAKWMGANPEDVSVVPNTDFGDPGLFADELVKLMTAKSMGAPISNETIHDIIADRGLTEKTFEEETAAIEGEQPTGATLDENGNPIAGGTANEQQTQQPTGGSDTNNVRAGA
jgi:hypothetical protein